MNNQKILVYNYPLVFEILNEIKNQINFEILQVNKNEINNFKNKNNCLIISDKKLIGFENLLKLENLPLPIDKLIEVININFIKIKFNQQSDTLIGKYKIDLNSRKLFYNNLELKLTEKETDILVFLNSSKKPKTINELQKKVWGHNSQLETHTVETHIYRLRKKILNSFQDKSLISSTKNGYYIK